MKRNAKGFIVPTILISVFFIITVSVAVLSLSVANNQNASGEVYRVNAQFAADSGLDVAVRNINADEAWAGETETTLFEDTKMKATYQTTVVAGATADKKTIKTTGRVYSPANATTPKVTRIYELDVEAITSGIGPSSVVSGVGGLIVNSNAKISGGDVYVNGKITINNNGQIGLSTNPVNVRAAHQSCPVPATSAYPSVCGPGNGQPITIGNNGKIYGNVQATNQTTGTNMSNPGLIAGQTVPAIDMPEHDRDAQKSAATNTLTANQAKCTNGTVTWPANVKITGDLVVTNNCTMIMQGDVWVTGKVDISNNATIRVADSLGTTRPTFMVDGQNGFKLSNNGVVQKNASNTGIFVVTYYSRASCSPDCGNVTGADLYDSQNDLTIDLGNNGSAQYSVFYSRWTKVRVSNNGALGAISGQTIELSNNAVISFTATVPGSSNLVKTWVKRGYLRVFN